MDEALVWELERKAKRPSGLEGIAGPYMEVDNAALIEETVKHVCQFLTDIGQDYVREQVEKRYMKPTVHITSGLANIKENTDGTQTVN